MYVAVILTTEPLKKVIIPIQWFQSVDVVQVFNTGVSKTKLHKVFFCGDIKEDPNFRLPIEKKFVDRPACYQAKVKCGFSK